MANTASPFALQRLLARLDHTLFSPDADSHLQNSQYERNRVGANIEHARTLLLTLEKQSATLRLSQAQQQQAKADLERKRDWIKKLNTRLRELDAIAENDEDEDSEDEIDREQQGDILSSYGPARHDTEAGLETGGADPDNAQNRSGKIDAAHIQQAISSQIQSEIRSRGGNARQSKLQASDNRSAASTSAREQLFSNRAKEPANDGSLQATETLMSHNRTEQESLTSGLLGLAKALKESSQQFGASLEAEKDILKNAEGGLDKNALGMDAAAQKMGTLRQMSEGQGWWGRMKLYAMIFGLWVACFLVVFVGPKIRL
ncbi:uncharacterized protein MYCFIDRAFT_149088 [Pseudocercospora fijiensis CIRAD86]|uniref:Synaptobrevin n=1 Tax=Pseudocercospora fijiensis (strain CIRAD86) TaxID=383855 RepID=N1Q738_PSEFD|nr:uncharacterized protein MYCFIDRAFT_149088 [Pseudocercospora fijiensis CIRAD86]EME88414.1 hypothetical protein MYCFIDRAFT_149088 [Pseudocercospora fijiensis CIRAD86]